MHIERKLTLFSLALLAICASLAFGQTAPARRGGSPGSSSQGQVAGPFESLNMTPMQQCLMDLISWKQSLAHHELGGSSTNFYSLSQEVKDARMEVVRACNLYHRATLTAAQQATYDKNILDPEGHPLPAKWENMRRKGTLVRALLQSTSQQQSKADEVLQRFRGRNSAIWGTGHKNGGYAKNHDLLLKEFRAILTGPQRNEFNRLWAEYTKHVDAAVNSVKP